MLSLFIAKRFFKNSRRKGDETASKASPPALRIATLGIAIGLAVMIVSLCVVQGFQREVSDKLTGFASHLEIIDLSSLSSPETHPIIASDSFIAEVRKAPSVVRVQRFSQKIGIFKTKNDFAGIMLKGVGSDYDLSFIKRYVVSGRLPLFGSCDTANEIMVSQTIANRLHLKVGDKVYSYYFSNTIKQRRFTVVGIYNTYMKQFDNNVVWADLQTVNQLNRWNANQCSGLELKLKSLDDTELAETFLCKQIMGRKDSNGRTYSLLSYKNNPTTASVVSWLDLLNFNINVILVIMMCVSGFSMISGLLILILERTNSIGILKALGATNRRIRHIFLWYAYFIVTRGLVLGNVIGLGLVLLQKYFHLIRLSAEIYYVPEAPIEINLWWIVGLNVVTLIITMLALITPSYLVSRIQPAQAIQFD